MQPKDAEQSWRAYCEHELSRAMPILQKLGFSLEEDQPHLGGERYLMQAVTTKSGRKLILLAHDNQHERVVIKMTSDQAGIAELEHERASRNVLQKINFAYQTFLFPDEILFTKQNGYVISVQRFIEQECSFLERTLENQFALALKSFKAQESAHATTSNHYRMIEKTFDVRNAKEYIAAFKQFAENISNKLPEQKELQEQLKKALGILRDNSQTIEQYCGFLTHTDFVPHNIRVVDYAIYLLDHSSLCFGNKYEGWARFINFMTLYNPPLETALLEYVENNRTPEESESLRLMRIYRLGEIIWYYTNTLNSCSGDLKALNMARVVFWSEVLASILDKKPVPEMIIEAYKEKRDSLRSAEEKDRQQGLH